MIDPTQKLSRKELNEEFLTKLLILAKTHANDSENYEIVKDFVDFAYIEAKQSGPSDIDYEPFI